METKVTSVTMYVLSATQWPSCNKDTLLLIALALTEFTIDCVWSHSITSLHLHLDSPPSAVSFLPLPNKDAESLRKGDKTRGILCTQLKVSPSLKHSCHGTWQLECILNTVHHVCWLPVHLWVVVDNHSSHCNALFIEGEVPCSTHTLPLHPSAPISQHTNTQHSTTSKAH